MRYDVLAAQLKQYPDRYRKFGKWWWTIKQAIREAGFDLGDDDHPDARAQLERAAGSPEAAIKAAMRHYTQQLSHGMFLDQSYTLPDGHTYPLADDSIHAHAVL